MDLRKREKTLARSYGVVVGPGKRVLVGTKKKPAYKLPSYKGAKFVK